MTRVKSGPATHNRHKKVIKNAKGYFGRRKNTFRIANQAVEKALQYAYRDRKARKRDFRRLWITRISAAAKMEGLTYSRLIYGLKNANIDLNRKNLSNISIENPELFAELVKKAKENIA